MIFSTAHVVILASILASGFASLDKRTNTWHWNNCFPCEGPPARPNACCCEGTNTNDDSYTNTLTSTSTSYATSTYAVRTTMTSIPTTIIATSTVRGTACFPKDKPGPTNCIQTANKDAGYCLCSGPVATSTAVPTTVSTTVTTTALSTSTLTTTTTNRGYPTGTPGQPVLISVNTQLTIFPFCNSTLTTILNPPKMDSWDLTCVAPYNCATW